MSTRNGYRGVHPSVRIDPTARINCEHLVIGAGGVVGANCVIEGARVEIGRELWMDTGATIGGGSCHDPCAFLKAGHWLHMGRGSHVNTARGVTIGDEVGIGAGTAIYTHGAYLDELAGFPCEFAPVVIGSRVWLPHAQVNPGVVIGSDVVVGAGALVMRSLSDGCLAVGAPAKAVRVCEYPKQLTVAEKYEVLDRIVAECRLIAPAARIERRHLSVLLYQQDNEHCDTAFYIGDETPPRTPREIVGRVSGDSGVIRNQLRRHGIRFRFSPCDDGWYRAWTES